MSTKALPLDLHGIFDPDSCALIEEGTYGVGGSFIRGDTCHHESRHGTECKLIHCPLLQEAEKARQLLIRRDLLATPPPSPATAVLAYGEDNDSHGPNEVWAWIDGRWRQREAFGEENDRVGFGYFWPSEEKFCRWVVEFFNENAPHILRQLSHPGAQFGLRHLPPDLAGGLRHVDAALVELVRNDMRRLDELSPYAFEELVAELLAGRGWQVRLVANRSTTGADLLATTKVVGDDTTLLYFIEVKKTSTKVGIEVIDRVLGGMLRHRPEPHLGMVVSLAGFKNFRDRSQWRVEGREYRRVRLAGRQDVVEWLTSYQPNPRGGLWLPERWLTQA